MHSGSCSLADSHLHHCACACSWSSARSEASPRETKVQAHPLSMHVLVARLLHVSHAVLEQATRMGDVTCTQSSSCSSKRTRTVAVAAVSMARTVINSTHLPVSTHAVSDPAGHCTRMHTFTSVQPQPSQRSSQCVQPLSFIRRALRPSARQTYIGSLLGDPRSTLVLPEPTKLVHPSIHFCLFSGQAARPRGCVPKSLTCNDDCDRVCQVAKRVKGQRGGMRLW